MSTSIGTPVTPPESVASTETKSAQIYTTVADMIADMENPGGDEVRLLRAIREASDYLQKEIGIFIPVTQTFALRGSGISRLHLPPFLQLTGNITNGTETLTSTDVIFDPAGRWWPHGPYDVLEIPSTGGQVWSDLDLSSVQVPVLAGLYDQTVTTDAAVAGEQSVAAEALTVDDGGQLSLGMVLKIGDEQELVKGWGDPTSNVTTISAACAVGDDVVTLTTPANIKVGEVIRIDFEKMLVRDKRGSQASVMRSWNKTIRVAHTISTQVDVYRTAQVERAVNGTVAAVHTAATEISRYVAPDDINFLCRQIATLMVNKAKGDYAGRTGNAETGQVFYNDAFPRYDIERVKQNYIIWSR